ncbi:MAG: signal peptidase I [Candidatus Omnitrophica bacterium]|nr:signal peptidase I [Candidatus Omnitrophota bacterium]MDD4012966.1 signal peptidase I [Candidatus Omnitrophota bacterium]
MKIDRKNWEYWWGEWIKPILIAAILAFFIRTFVAQPFKIPSNSMYPALKPGDRIFVSKFIYGARIPLTDIRLPKVRDARTGDIVVFTSPVEKDKYLVKRFITGGGHTVQIKDGGIYVDGRRIETKPIDGIFYYGRGEYGEENKVIEVPEGTFYVLGDNSPNSMDSRYWGFVPDKNLVGKAFIIHWPFGRIRLIREGD